MLLFTCCFIHSLTINVLFSWVPSNVTTAVCRLWWINLSPTSHPQGFHLLISDHCLSDWPPHCSFTLWGFHIILQLSKKNSTATQWAQPLVEAGLRVKNFPHFYTFFACKRGMQTDTEAFPVYWQLAACVGPPSSPFMFWTRVILLRILGRCHAPGGLPGTWAHIHYLWHLYDFNLYLWILSILILSLICFSKFVHDILFLLLPRSAYRQPSVALTHTHTHSSLFLLEVYRHIYIFYRGIFSMWLLLEAFPPSPEGLFSPGAAVVMGLGEAWSVSKSGAEQDRAPTTHQPQCYCPASQRLTPGAGQ